MTALGIPARCVNAAKIMEKNTVKYSYLLADRMLRTPFQCFLLPTVLVAAGNRAFRSMYSRKRIHRDAFDLQIQFKIDKNGK